MYGAGDVRVENIPDAEIIEPIDVVSERGEEAVERARDLTGGYGVHSVLECVGTDLPMQTAVDVARPGGAIGRVGVPHDVTIPPATPTFYNNLTLWLLVMLGMIGCVESGGHVTQPAPLPTLDINATEMPTPVASTVARTPTITSTATPEPEEESMEIRLTVNDTVVTATLVDSETTRDFVSLLPLTLTLEDYAGTEKVSDLPQRLSTEGAPAGSNPSVGDITYYAPWGNLAIFYRDFGYASGLVILGKIDSGMEALNVPGSVTVTIELVE